MKKNITLKDWTYIGQYNPARKWLRPLCSYSLEQLEDGGFRRIIKIGLIPYLLMFIPLHLLQALCCMWDGGLKEFEIEPRLLGYDDFHETWGGNRGAFPRAKEIWEKHK